MTGKKISISRKDALETLCRSVTHLNDYGFLKLEEQKASGFSDYQVPPKYAEGFAYLRGKQVVRGYGGSAFGVKRALSKKEAVSLLYRLYERVSSDRAKTLEPKKLTFVDISDDHPVMEQLRGLQKAGAFDALEVGPSFDGEHPVRLKDLCAMACGVMARSGKTADVGKIQIAIQGKDTEASSTRRDLATVLAILAGSLSVEKKVAPVSYQDLAPGSALEESLTALAGHGVVLGYPNGFIRQEETISWFEGVGVIAALGKTMNWFEEEKKEELAGKADFEAYANVLRAKKARIHAILQRKAPEEKPQS